MAGDFDGDNLDEILWYAPGPAADYLWNFTGYGTYTTRPYTVNTLPPETFAAYRDHGEPVVRIREGMARAESDLLTIDPEELVDAGWYARVQLIDPERRPIGLPNRDSIARHLIEDWLYERGD